jgi:hypothetical protein
MHNRLMRHCLCIEKEKWSRWPNFLVVWTSPNFWRGHFFYKIHARWLHIKSDSIGRCIHTYWGWLDFTKLRMVYIIKKFTKTSLKSRFNFNVKVWTWNYPNQQNQPDSGFATQEPSVLIQCCQDSTWVQCCQRRRCCIFTQKRLHGNVAVVIVKIVIATNVIVSMLWWQCSAIFAKKAVQCRFPECPFIKILKTMFPRTTFPCMTLRALRLG